MNTTIANDAIQRHLDIATRIAVKGGEVLAGAAESRRVRLEEGRDIKIEADFILDRFILDSLRREAPLPILSEESGGDVDTGSERWIVDPLDGSFNYVRGLPLACISIGLWRGMTPLAGVVYDFSRRECFSGIVGVGAWLNGEAISTSRTAKTSHAVLCSGIPSANVFGDADAASLVRRIRAFKKTRLLGSAALMLAYVACGRADAYHEESIAVWDVAAGVALVNAAGGRVEWRTREDPRLLDVRAHNGVLEEWP